MEGVTSTIANTENYQLLSTKCPCLLQSQHSYGLHYWDLPGDSMSDLSQYIMFMHADPLLVQPFCRISNMHSTVQLCSPCHRPLQGFELWLVDSIWISTQHMLHMQLIMSHLLDIEGICDVCLTTPRSRTCCSRLGFDLMDSRRDSAAEFMLILLGACTHARLHYIWSDDVCISLSSLSCFVYCCYVNLLDPIILSLQ